MSNRSAERRSRVAWYSASASARSAPSPVVCGDRTGEELGVAEGVGESVDADRVLPVAGVADERPPRSPAAAEEPGRPGERAHRRVARSPRRLGRRARARPRRGPRATPSTRPGPRRAGARAGEDARLAVVGGDHPGDGSGPVDPLVAVGVEPGPVAVHDGGGARADPFDRSADAGRRSWTGRRRRRSTMPARDRERSAGRRHGRRLRQTRPRSSRLTSVTVMP